MLLHLLMNLFYERFSERLKSIHPTLRAKIEPAITTENIHVTMKEGNNFLRSYFFKSLLLPTIYGGFSK